MADALLRHWQMLSLVPRAPRKVSTTMLQDQLHGRGFVVNQRSIQRDLHKLSAHFPLVCDERSKPFGWSWAKQASIFDVPGMDLHTALAFALAAEHLAHLLPHATLSYLKPHFSHADRVLEHIDDNELNLWRQSIRVLPSGLPMAPPSVDPGVLEAIHDGLLHRRRLKVTYRNRGESKSRSHEANPVGLVYRDSIAYLVAALWDYDNVVQLALHRMTGVSVLDRERRMPDGFDLDGYIASGAFGFVVGEEPIALVARLQPSAAVRLFETPLSNDQVLKMLDDGRVEARATVADTAQLRVWLRGHGAMCEVVAPVALREEIAAELRRAAGLYG